jgi:hypothetical protein
VDFVTLYGTELDRELGTADRDQRFTTVRRKAAINAGQLEFVKRTECLQRQASVTLVDATQEVDLEASVTDFGWIAKQGISIAITSGTTTRYLEGDDLEVTSVANLNVEEPGWRAESAGTPRKVYIRREGGALNLGLHPKPSITAGDTWVALVPYVVVPTDLSADADEPFTVSSNAIRSLRPWHRALVYFAAFDLEKLRKDVGRQQAALQLFELEIQRYTNTDKPKHGQRVRFARVYRALRSATLSTDPRT